MLGTTIAPSSDMKTIMPRFCSAALLGAALLVPLAMAPIALRAEDNKSARTYHDKKHNDDHEWNAHEDQAYRVYAKENHRKYTDFPSSTTTINRRTGAGVTNILTPCSRLISVRLDSRWFV